MPFESSELAALRDAVAIHGVNAWEHVAAALAARGFGGRTAMGCHRGWRTLIDYRPANAPEEDERIFWTAEEDERLVRAMIATGDCNAWAEVARHLPGKTAKQCQYRWAYTPIPTETRPVDG